MEPLTTFSPESFRAITRNLNMVFQSIRIHSESHTQHRIRTQQCQEIVTKMDTIQ